MINNFNIHFLHPIVSTLNLGIKELVLFYSPGIGIGVIKDKQTEQCLRVYLKLGPEGNVQISYC